MLAKEQKKGKYLERSSMANFDEYLDNLFGLLNRFELPFVFCVSGVWGLANADRQTEAHWL